MISGIIKGYTRFIGRSQGYDGLAIRDTTVNCTVNGPGTPCMETEWHPSPEELKQMLEGKPITIRILGRSWPPIAVFVEE